MQDLITGAGSGLGKYLAQQDNAIAFTRENHVSQLRGKGFRWVVHAAFNRCRDTSSAGLAQIIRDNLLLTEQLLALDYEAFVFISSIDVYPRTPNRHHEEEVIDPSRVSGIYGLTKLMAESLVRSSRKRYIILRPGLLIGECMRPNNVSRIANEPGVTLTLAGESNFYLVSYKDIGLLLSRLLDREASGIFNVVMSSPISLQDVAQVTGGTPKFGSFVYDSGRIDNTKAEAVLPSLGKPSSEVLTEYMARKHSAPAGK